MKRINDVYTLQGVRMQDIAARFGTPVYVYDADKIITQLTILKSTFSGIPLKIKYAAKALTNLAILQLIKKNGAGVDVVSIEEARLALKAGFTPSEIMYTPNCVDFDEIMACVTMGVGLNIDNVPMLEKFGQKYGKTYPTSIRFNPHVMAGGNLKIATGHSHSKFGISIEQIDEVLDVVKKYNIDINGLHVHTGSEITDIEIFLKVAGIMFEAAMLFPSLEFLDFGGGFKVAYKEGDKVTNMEELGKKLSEAINTFSKRYGKQLEICFEPGKYLVSEAGYLLVKANVVKQTPTVKFIGVNSGLNHLIRPMMYDAYHHIVNISNPQGEEQQYSVVGYICETDTLGSDRTLNEVREGDTLAILNAGAYGYSMASNYNSRIRPAEVIVINGEAKLIRARETFEDLLRGQVELKF